MLDGDDRREPESSDLVLLGVETEDARKRIAAAFMVRFASQSDHDIARDLKISVRSAQGLRRSDRAPQKATARRMLEIMRERDEVSRMNPAEFADYLERRRREQEAYQRKVPIEDRRDDEIYLRAPSWYRTAAEELRQGEYRSAAILLRDRLAPGERRAVEPAILPYALNKLALAELYCGRVAEAVEAASAAITAGLKCPMKASSIAALRTNLAGMQLRMQNPERALATAMQAVDGKIDHLPGYYIALCAASALRQSGVLAIWIGRTIQAMKMHGVRQELELFGQRMGEDPDLAWARIQPEWNDLRSELQAVLGSMQ